MKPLISQVRVVVPELLHTSACEAASAKQSLLQVQQSTRRMVVRLQVVHRGRNHNMCERFGSSSGA